RESWRGHLEVVERAADVIGVDAVLGGTEPGAHGSEADDIAAVDRGGDAGAADVHLEGEIGVGGVRLGSRGPGRVDAGHALVDVNRIGVGVEVKPPEVVDVGDAGQ